MATIRNQATLLYNGITTKSNITTGELVEVISAAKTAVVTNYDSDSIITYIISIVNSGNSSFTNLKITDNLGQYESEELRLVPLDYVRGSLRYYVNGILQESPEAGGTPFVIAPISLTANGNAVIVYQARPNEFAPLEAEGSITNKAVISGDGLSAPINIEETVYVRSAARLSISKSMTPTVISGSDQVTYTFIIQNTGNTAITTADNVIISDVFDPVLDITSVTFNGKAWTEPDNYTYNEETGLFTSGADQVTVPAASYTANPETGAIVINPGISTLVIKGTI